MKTGQAIEIVGQLEDFLNIPSFLCEYLQKELEEEHYQEVIEYIIERKNEDVESQKEKCLKEIEKLNKCIKDDKENANEIMAEQQKEIERLKNGCKELEQQIDDLHKLETIITNENERLNNIISEFEKWLKEKQILYGINTQGFSWGVCGEALDKLQELKGEKNV